MGFERYTFHIRACVWRVPRKLLLEQFTRMQYLLLPIFSAKLHLGLSAAGPAID